MVFMSDKNYVELDLMYIGLDAIKFQGSMNGSTPTTIDSKKEKFLIPSINFVSSNLGKARVGLSISVPGGLTKRWSASPAKDVAEEFTLEVVEINPSVAFALSDSVAFGAGIRILSSSGIVKNSAAASRNLKGDSIDCGYNLALSYRPTASLELSTTYRSNVDLSEKGNSKLYIGQAQVYDGGASVTVPLPASLNFAVAYTLESKTTLEVVYERTYWSEYKSLDFDYASAIPTVLRPSMDAAIAKNWKDTNVFRFGITQKLDGAVLMAGVVIDESPVPDASLSFELPDSDSVAFSMGGRYSVNETVDVGLSALYSIHDKRTVTSANNNNNINGEFSNANVLLVSAGVGYKF
jgi:long-chain fatty acid transport protein